MAGPRDGRVKAMLYRRSMSKYVDMVNVIQSKGHLNQSMRKFEKRLGMSADGSRSYEDMLQDLKKSISEDVPDEIISKLYDDSHRHGRVAPVDPMMGYVLGMLRENEYEKRKKQVSSKEGTT